MNQAGSSRSRMQIGRNSWLEIRDEVAARLTIVTGCRVLEEVLKRSIVRLVFPETPVKFQGS